MNYCLVTLRLDIFLPPRWRISSCECPHRLSDKLLRAVSYALSLGNSRWRILRFPLSVSTVYFIRLPLFLIFPTRLLRDVVHVVPCRWSGIIGSSQQAATPKFKKLFNRFFYGRYAQRTSIRAVFCTITCQNPRQTSLPAPNRCIPPLCSYRFPHPSYA